MKKSLASVFFLSQCLPLSHKAPPVLLSDPMAPSPNKHICAERRSAEGRWAPLHCPRYLQEVVNTIWKGQGGFSLLLPGRVPHWLQSSTGEGARIVVLTHSPCQSWDCWPLVLRRAGQGGQGKEGRARQGGQGKEGCFPAQSQPWSSLPCRALPQPQP